MLRVAAQTTAHLPRRQFLHYGPVPRGEEIYGRSCVALHERLGLGERFRFMGPTADPTGVVRASDVVLMTSISEGLPMAILEAMGQARPVVSTGVGGVPEVVRGCGMVCAPGDDHGAVDRGRHVVAQPRAGLATRSARAQPSRPALQRDGVYRRLPRAARHAHRQGRRAPGCRGARMTAPTMEPQEARLLVEARLGRAPQDMLEAAVVLEAWAGVPAQTALAAASATMPVEPASPQPSAGRLPRHREGDRVLADGAAFLVCVVAIACWAAPLTSDMGVHGGRARARARAAADAGAAAHARQPLPRPAAGHRAARALPRSAAGGARPRCC